MTGRNPDGTEDFPSPGCSDVAYGPQRLNAIIGAYEAFLDPVCGTDDLSFRLVLELPAAETPSARRHPPAPNWMIWERRHIEVVRAAATGNARRAADLLREHLASIGCDPLAFRITAMLRQPAGKNDDFDNLASQLPGCHTTPWPCPP
jgi:hypothetical protein